MKKLSFFLFFFFSSLYALVFFNPYEKKNFSINAESAFDFASVYDVFSGRWNKFYNKSGKNIGYLNYRVASGFYYKNFYFSIFQRGDYFLKTNNQTAEFVYQLVNHQAKKNKFYNDLYIYVKGFRSRGFNVSYLSKIDKNFSYFVSLSMFNVYFIQDSNVNGWGYFENNRYDYNVHADYYYSKNYLYYIKVTEPKGYGYTSHLGFLYKKDNYKLLFIINDLYSKIIINNAPYSNVYLNSKNKHIVNGYIHYSPIFYGIEKYVNYKSRYNPKYLLKIQYNKYFLENQRWFNINFPSFGIKTKHFNLSYGFRFKNVDINLHFKNFYFVIG